MLLKDIKNILKCKVLTNRSQLNEEIKYCFAADLMSDVLRYARTGSLLLTGLTNVQVLQVAEILDLKGILFVRGKVPENEVIEQASKRELPLLSTNELMFDSCAILFNQGLKGGRSKLTDKDEAKNTVPTVVQN